MGDGRDGFFLLDRIIVFKDQKIWENAFVEISSRMSLDLKDDDNVCISSLIGIMSFSFLTSFPGHQQDH